MIRKNRRKKALVAMSGGVDSSVAALISKKRGFECEGVTMSLFDDDIGEDVDKANCSSNDIEDAKKIAEALNIPFYVFDFSEYFKADVIDRFVKAYVAGLTPNPCIDCNKHIKYHRLVERAMAMGFDYIVTGHYAKIEKDDVSGRYLLKMAEDKSKDQSYFLYMLSQKQLASTIFPLGELPKTDVRDIAEENGFLNARKRDSQDICFVSDGKYAEFIEGYSNKTYPEGNFVDSKGNNIGKHNGIIRYTIGQRKGLGQTFGEPMYVLDIIPKRNEVVLGSNEELYSDTFYIREINMISVKELSAPMKVTAKVRYNQEVQPATAVQTGKDEIMVVFDEPQRAITKGQAAVLYDRDIVVGGGIIYETKQQ